MVGEQKLSDAAENNTAVASADSSNYQRRLREVECLSPVLRLAQFLKIYISQGSVSTRFGCGGIFNDSFFIANVPESGPVEEFRKSVGNWQSYRSSLV